MRGLMMIGIEGRGGDRIMARLTGLPAVTAVHSTNGKWDPDRRTGDGIAGRTGRGDPAASAIWRVMTSETNLFCRRAARPAAGRRRNRLFFYWRNQFCRK